MITNILKHTARFVFFILLQVLILNNIQFNGYVNPYLYVFIILMLPFETPVWLMMVISFAAGLLVDMFQDSMGMHASACVAMGYARSFILKLFSPREGYDVTTEPTLYYLGTSWYMSYSFILVTIHHLVFFTIEAFSFYQYSHTLLRLLFSLIFTMLLLLMSQMLIYKPKGSKK